MSINSYEWTTDGLNDELNCTYEIIISWRKIGLNKQIGNAKIKRFSKYLRSWRLAITKKLICLKFGWLISK